MPVKRPCTYGFCSVGFGARADLSLVVQFEEFSRASIDQRAQAAKQFAEALAMSCTKSRHIRQPTAGGRLLPASEPTAA
jgi:hypothetical protein